MEIVSSTEGSSTRTGWKRRTSGGSCSCYLRSSSSVVAPMQCRSPRASIGLSRFPASIDPSVFPAPTTVCSSSMNSTISPAASCTSFSTAFSRSSNSPRNFAPAISAPMSSDTTFLFFSPSGTSPRTMRLRIVSMVIEAGRALVVAYNKWDMVGEDRQHYLEREIERQLYTARWAPRVNISAATGRHTDRLVPAIEKALAGWETRVSTGRLNAWLTGLVAATPPPVRGGKQPKILFATQAGVRPPHFVLFSSGFLEAAYRRFIERKLREEFGFEGSPVQVSVRVRAKRESRGGRRSSNPSARAERRH